MNRFVKFFLFFLIVISVSTCKKETYTPVEPVTERSTIVVLFENDVHCAIDGYTNLAGLRDAISDTAYVAVVSSGDYLQGGTCGAISAGQYIIDIMKTMNYDAVTIGNHEFDYQTQHMIDLLATINAPVVCCNLYDMDDNRIYAPYVIKSYGTKRIAYVGVLTPSTQYEDEIYAFYDSVGNQLYDTRRDTYKSLVQQSVTAARNEGADYVILLSHLGENINGNQYNSNDLIASTSGIDVVLDGHTHSVIDTVINNILGEPVSLCQTGTQFANIGRLVITKDGEISTSIIPIGDVTYSNAEVTAAIDRVNELVEEQTGQVVFHSDVPILITDGNGVRMVRKAETNAGDIVTDAMRHEVDADIAMINGGGVRNDIAAGDVKYADVINMLPFEDYVWKVEATGAKILEVLQIGVSNLPNENGEFAQVSGLRFTTTVSDHSVNNVEVLRADGTYEALDPDAKYSVALLDYCVTGGGFSSVFNGCTVLQSSNVLYCDVLVNYVKEVLNGNVSDDYANPQGRITIEQ